MTVGLIGFGRFGRLAARFIAKRTTVVVYDNRPLSRKNLPRAVRSVSLQVAASQRVIVLAVPISGLKDTLRAIREFVQPGALVIDVCSVKERPVQWMKEILPHYVSILGSHPLFGPDTVSDVLHGQTIVLCPVRISKSRIAQVKEFVQREGARVLMMTPASHDRLIAETIFLTQYVGRLVHHCHLPRWPAYTTSYVHLLALVDIAKHDTKTLFADMSYYNRHGRRIRRALQIAQKHLMHELQQ